MKLGIFDSGLGGLVIAHAIRHALPEQDMVYLGDTLHVPYGNRSQDAIFEFTRAAIDFLFSQKDCALIVIACNTASASALRRLQQEYLPVYYPRRRILGVIVPTLETALEKGVRRLGVLGTSFIVKSEIYRHEMEKLKSGLDIRHQAAPLLVPMIEQGGIKWVKPVLESYLAPLTDFGIDSLILGCTHYPLLRPIIRELIPPQTIILSQDDIIPGKLSNYLDRHPEINSLIKRNRHTEFLVTDVTDSYLETAERIYGAPVEVKKVTVSTI